MAIETQQIGYLKRSKEGEGHAEESSNREMGPSSMLGLFFHTFPDFSFGADCRPEVKRSLQKNTLPDRLPGDKVISPGSIRNSDAR
jgi:hypothetical protein